MAIKKVSGTMLQQNLSRDGIPIVFDGNLLYVDVVNRRIGINTTSPTTDFQVTGPTQLGNIVINGNEITHTDADAQIKLGDISTVHITGGNANNILFTDGTGNLAFTSMQTLFALNNITTNNIPFRPAAITANVNQSTVTYSTNALTTGQSLSQAISTLDSILGNITNASGNVITTGNLFLTGGAQNYILATDGNGRTFWSNISSIVSQTKFDGTGVQLGANTRGSLTSAVPLVSTTTITDSVALLNELLGKFTTSTGQSISVQNNLRAGGNIVADNNISVTNGKFYGNIQGTVLTATQPNITTVGNLGNLVVNNSITTTTVTGQTFYGNLIGNLAGDITGNIVGNVAGTTGSFSGSLTAGNVFTNNGTFSGNIYGNIGTAAQPYITSLGTLTGLTATGPITSSSLTTQAAYVNGALSAGSIVTSGDVSIGNNLTISGSTTLSTLIVRQFEITTGNLTSNTGMVSPAFYGNTYNGVVANFTSNVGALNFNAVNGVLASNIRLTSAAGRFVGNVTGTLFGNVNAATGVFTNSISTTDGFFSGNIYGNVISSTQSAITSLGTLTYLNVSGNVTANNIIANSTIYSPGFVGTLLTPVQPNITTVGSLGNLTVNTSIQATTVTAQTYYGNVIGSSANITLNVTANNIIANSTIYSPGFVGTLQTPVQPNITTVGKLGNLTVNTSITATTVTAQTYYGNVVGSSANITTIDSANITGANITVGNDDDISGYLTVTADANVYGNLAVGTDEDGPYNLTVNGTIAATGNVSSNEFYGNIRADRIDSLYSSVIEFTSQGAVGLPHGDTSQRPALAKGGYVRYNTDVPGLEYYDGGAWVEITNTVRNQIITPDGVNNRYLLDHTTTAAGSIVSINGTVQQPGMAYTMSESNNNCYITFNETPLPTDIVDVRFMGATVNFNTTLSDNLTIYGNLTTNSVTTGAFTIAENNNRVVVSCNGVKVFAINSRGDVTIAGNISYGPIA